MKVFDPDMSDPDMQKLHILLHTHLVPPIFKGVADAINAFIQATKRPMEVEKIISMAIAMGFMHSGIEFLNLEDGQENPHVAEFKRLLETVLPKYQADISPIENPAGGNFVHHRNRHRDNGTRHKKSDS